MYIWGISIISIPSFFVMPAITVAVAKQPGMVSMWKSKPFCTPELSNDNKDFPLFTIYSWPLIYCYAKTTCPIPFKLTAFNNDTLSFLNINFLRDWLSFKVAINFTHLMR